MEVNREQLVQKLKVLNGTQQSIESTASWCLFYSRAAGTVVSIWLDEFVRMSPDKRLTQLYLANHILQEGKKKGREYGDEFAKVMPRVMKEFARGSDSKSRASVMRLIKIWEERRVFGGSLIKVMKDALARADASPASRPDGMQPTSSGDAAKLKVCACPMSPCGMHDTWHALLCFNFAHGMFCVQAVGPLADILGQVASAADRSASSTAKVMQLKPVSAACFKSNSPRCMQHCFCWAWVWAKASVRMCHVIARRRAESPCGTC